MMDISGVRMLVHGLGLSGMAVIRAAVPRGASVCACDDRDEARAAMLPELTRLGVPLLTPDEAASGEFDLCVVTPGVRPGNALVSALERRGVELISEIELAARLAPCPIAAVTGTNGKSTTTVLAGLMLRASGLRCGIGGNLSAEGYDLPLITAAVSEPAHDALCAEVSSAQLERCYQFRPKAAALLNITPDHFDRYAGMDDYAAAKMRIFQAQHETDFAVLGLDDPMASALGAGVRARKLWFSARQEPNEGAFLRGDALVLRFEGDEQEFCRTGEMRLWAPHDWLNAAAAACIARAMGATIHGIREAAVTFPGLADRMEHCATIGGVRWINSSMCTNPAAGAAAVRAVAERFPAVVIAGGAGKKLDYAEWGEAVARSAKRLLLIGKSASDLQQAAEAAGANSIEMFETMREAMEAARCLAQPGDAVILAPAMASFGEFQNFRERGRVFRQIVSTFGKEAEQ